MTSQPNVCWVVASKDSTGEYIPENTVYEDVEEAITVACEILDQDPTADPRLVQVILDPEHPCLRVGRALGEVRHLLEGKGLKETYRAGVQDTIDILEEQQGVLTLAEVEEGGKEPKHVRK